MLIDINVKNNYPFALGIYPFQEGKYPNPTEVGIFTVASGASLKRETSGDPVLIDVPGMSSIFIQTLAKGPLESYKEVLLNEKGRVFQYALLIRFEGVEILQGFDQEHAEISLSIDAYGTLNVQSSTQDSKQIEIKIPEIVLH